MAKTYYVSGLEQVSETIVVVFFAWVGEGSPVSQMHTYRGDNAYQDACRFLRQERQAAKDSGLELVFG